MCIAKGLAGTNYGRFSVPIQKKIIITKLTDLK